MARESGHGTVIRDLLRGGPDCPFFLCYVCAGLPIFFYVTGSVRLAAWLGCWASTVGKPRSKKRDTLIYLAILVGTGAKEYHSLFTSMGILTIILVMSDSLIVQLQPLGFGPANRL